jgi:hypothetical protein
MIRGFVSIALCVLVGFATLALWPSRSPEFEDALRALASVTGPDAARLTFSAARSAGHLVTAWILVSVAFVLALASAAWLMRPWSRRVAVGTATGALAAIVLAALAMGIGNKVAQFRAAAALDSAKSSSPSPP